MPSPDNTNLINAAALESLIAGAAWDDDVLGLIESAIAAFETYHGKVIAHEFAQLIHTGGDYAKVAAADHDRTIAHNSMLSKVGQLNRLAAAQGLPPIYAGIVSQDQPYRREVATAVFAYLQTIIEHRS